MKRTLAMLALAAFAGCASPTAPAPEQGPGCTLTQYVRDRDGRVWAVSAHYSLCPDTTGWHR